MEAAAARRSRLLGRCVLVHDGLSARLAPMSLDFLLRGILRPGIQEVGVLSLRKGSIA
jgi:hypothetical protein